MSHNNKDEEELEDLLLRAEDLSGWNHWESSQDPRKLVYKDFLRIAIEPLKERIVSLEAELAAIKKNHSNG